MDTHVALHIAADAPPERLVLVAKYCLQHAGICVDEIDVLAKATGRLQRRGGSRSGSLQEESSAPLPHPDLDARWVDLSVWGVQWPDTLHAAILALVEHPALLEKAQRWSWVLPLRPALWAALQRELGRVTAAAVSWLIGKRFVHPRALPPEALPDVLADSYGHAAGIGLGIHAPHPLTRTEQEAIRYARLHAGERLKPVFSGLNSRLMAGLLEAEQHAVRTRTHQMLTSRTGPSALASVLGREHGFQRDWHRVARTELVEAYSQGALAAMIARHPSNAEAVAQGKVPGIPGVRVYKIPSVNACVHCKRIWLEADGSPRLYPLGDVLANGTNEGLSASEWRAVVGPIHPNCTEGSLQEYTEAVETVFAMMREAFTQARA